MSIKVTAGEKGADLRSTAGVRVILKPNEEREIPDFLLGIAQQQGCIPTSAIEAAAEKRLQAQTPAPQPAADPDPENTSKSAAETREAQIRDALSHLMEKNDPADFTGSGSPRVNVVSDILGYEVKAAEIAPVYKALMDDNDS